MRCIRTTTPLSASPRIARPPACSSRCSARSPSRSPWRCTCSAAEARFNSHGEGTVANTVNWGVHAFHVLSMEADWNDEPGVYIFAGIQADALWHAYYVGSTESFKARLQDHDHWG